jgi:hypothetical protein
MFDTDEEEPWPSIEDDQPQPAVVDGDEEDLEVVSSLRPRATFSLI